MAVLDFQGKSYYAENGNKWGIFGPKISIFEFSKSFLIPVGFSEIVADEKH